MQAEIVIATRRSPLALWQAHHVKHLLEAAGHGVRLKLVTTTGDMVLDRPLDKVGGKGLFLKEIEQALACGEADIAVHSLKDVPMELPPGFQLGCVLEREDPRDALVSRAGVELRQLPPAARVGTSSLRRAMMIRQMRPDLTVSFIRGNVDSRLAKLDRGEFDAIVLAVAGMRRLGLEDRISQRLCVDDMLPAVGQGAVAIELLSSRTDLLAALRPLADAWTELCVAAEREVGRRMSASCSEAFAAHAHAGAGGAMVLRAHWSTDAASAMHSAAASCVVSDTAGACELGATVAAQLKVAIASASR